MLDLKKIISQLDSELFVKLEEGMKKSKAENSLYLLQTYRTQEVQDSEILAHLNINPNSLYTLKSRLYDKIQSQLTSKNQINELDLLGQVNEVHQICYTNSKEIAVAYLTKLEEGLLKKDMHGELLVVYSALKQLHLFSDKYFHYSQLYNKQIAYSLTIEKSLEILGNFNRILALYDFSKSDSDAETLLFLHKGIEEQYSLNSSKQIELIKYIIEIQLYLFCKKHNEELKIEPAKKLTRAVEIINELPQNAEQKQWLLAINFLQFEYAFQLNDEKKSSEFFETVNSSVNSLPFYCNICLVSKFFNSKINFTQSKKEYATFKLEPFNNQLIDSKNIHLIVELDIYNSFCFYLDGKLKEAISVLNNLLNNISLKDLHFINVEIKLTLAFYYIKKKEFDLAETILKSIARKLKAENNQSFAYVNNLIKCLLLESGHKSKLTKSQQSDLLTLFSSKNKTLGFVNHLTFELNTLYQIDA